MKPSPVIINGIEYIRKDEANRITPEERNEVIKECIDHLKSGGNYITATSLSKLLTPEKPKIKTKEFVKKWMDGHGDDTFVKNKHGVYVYTDSTGASSLNLESFFEDIIDDYADQLKTELPSEGEFMSKYLEIIEHDTEYEQDAQDLYKWLVNRVKG
jgi:hypothetical protein